MRNRVLPKGKFKLPDPKRTYDRNGKDDIVRYVEQFDRINALVTGGTFVKGKQI